MEIEKTEFGLKATVPLITEDEIKTINNDFDSTIDKFIKIIIKDKDLAIAQYIIKKQQEQINELKRNSIPKIKIEDKIKELVKKLNEPNNDRWEKEDSIYYDKLKVQIKTLQELLEDK